MSPDRPAPAINTGPGRTLVAVYALFAVAATGRSTLQLVTDPDRAPLAYSLSVCAALLYVVATVCFVVGDRARRVAVVACSIELIGVLGIGALSLARPDLFPDRTVWSHFGQGYGFVPLLLPVVGLSWVAKQRPTA